MKPETIEMLNDMLGDNKAEFIAHDLKEAYHQFKKDLVREIEEPGSANLMYDDTIEEQKYIIKYMEALRFLYEHYYSTENIDE